jgi:hypothetical protein
VTGQRGSTEGVKQAVPRSRKLRIARVVLLGALASLGLVADVKVETAASSTLVKQSRS